MKLNGLTLEINKIFLLALFSVNVPCYAQSDSASSELNFQETSSRNTELTVPDTDSSDDNSNTVRDDTQSGMSDPEKTRQLEAEQSQQAAQQKKDGDYSASFLFGADFGLQSAFPSTKLDSFGPKYGLAVESKAIGSIQFKKIMVDAGVGWYFFNLSGKEPRRVNGVILTTDNDVDIVDELGIKLSGTVLEVASSYFISSEFFSGLVMQVRYPSDLGYDSLVVRDKLGVSVGIQGGYQILDEDLNTRFVGRLMTSANDINWISASLMFGIQVGIPVGQKPPQIAQGIKDNAQPEAKKAENRPIEDQKAEFKRPEYKIQNDGNVTKLTLEDVVTFYDVPGQPTLTQEAQSAIMALAESIVSIQQNWTQIKIETVSKEHAQVIKDALVSHGLSESKIEVDNIFVGERVSNPKVELHFLDIKDRQGLTEQVKKAMETLKIFAAG